MQLRVVKSDGSVEGYIFTKVLGAINNALASAGGPDFATAAELAQAVTYYLYHERQSPDISSSDILSMIVAALCATGHDDAAIALKDHHFGRRLKRLRTEVAAIDVGRISDAGKIRDSQLARRSPWDKSRIIDDLVMKDHIPRQAARVIAAMVEERVFQMGLPVVPASMVKQLVLNDAAAVLRARQELQSV
jgi:hypothetical protein